MTWRVRTYHQDYNSGAVTSFDEYLNNTTGWIAGDPYAIFPNLSTTEAARDRQYLYKKITSPTILLDDDLITYVICTYDQVEYDREVARLYHLCGEMDNQTFALPAYVIELHFPNQFSSYALCDQSSRTIYYVANQGKMTFERYSTEIMRPV